MSKISVIIPLYNKARHIQRCLDSVLSQSFSDFEVIVVDDGSTDSGVDLIKGHYHDIRLRVVSQENGGPGSARNHGVGLAESEYIAFLDADDQWLPHFLADQYNNLVRHPECAVSMCRYGINHVSNTGNNDLALQERAGVFRLSAESTVQTLSEILRGMTTGNMLWRKEILLEYKGFYEHKCLFGEDQFLMINILLNHRIYISQKLLFIYHLDSSNLTKSRKGFADLHAFRPLALHPEYVRSNCPAELKKLLEKYLTILAFKECCGLITPYNIDTVRHICKMYPDITKVCALKYPRKYLKLQTKIPIYRLINKVIGIFG